MSEIKKKSIPELILSEGLASEESLSKALDLSNQNGKPVQENLVALKCLDQKKFVELLSKEMDMTLVDLSTYPIQHDAANLIPEYIAREHKALPIQKLKGLLTVAMFNPFNMEGIDAIEQFSNCSIKIVLTTLKGVDDAIEKYFGMYGEIRTFLSQIDAKSLSGLVEKTESEKEQAEVEVEGPVAQIIKRIIYQAVKMGGSDIHMEPLEKSFRIRMRIDGLLQEVLTFEKTYQAAITASLKIMSQMDIAETRLPQDGRFRTSVSSKRIDLRVSTFPASYGEKIVLRILDKSSLMIELESIGFLPDDLEKLKRIITKPYGLFLVTGPTGSGKTTTLYTILRRINQVAKNIITLEDPIEYDLENINQGQVQQKAGLTFASGLRSILRQDPDIIMVGEIRDCETAEIAIQAALTGHFVLSTLHTNDAASAPNRLIDMNIEPFLISSAIEGVLSQRLARKLCTNCKEEYIPTNQILDKFEIQKKNLRLFKPKGCRMCARTGYRGRLGIYELMEITDDLRALIVEKKSADELKKMAVINSMNTLRADGIQKVIQGITSLEEVARIAGRSA